jgi:hypothetical protein
MPRMCSAGQEEQSVRMKTWSWRRRRRQRSPVCSYVGARVRLRADCDSHLTESNFRLPELKNFHGGALAGGPDTEIQNTCNVQCYKKAPAKVEAHCVRRSGKLSLSLLGWSTNRGGAYYIIAPMQ